MRMETFFNLLVICGMMNQAKKALNSKFSTKLLLMNAINSNLSFQFFCIFKYFIHEITEKMFKREVLIRLQELYQLLHHQSVVNHFNTTTIIRMKHVWLKTKIVFSKIEKSKLYDPKIKIILNNIIHINISIHSCSSCFISHQHHILSLTIMSNIIFL